MPVDHAAETVIETVTRLAGEIARASPESADKALQIVDLVKDLRPRADRQAIQDAIESEAAGADISETQLRATTSAVVDALGRDA